MFGITETIEWSSFPEPIISQSEIRANKGGLVALRDRQVS